MVAGQCFFLKELVNIYLYSKNKFYDIFIDVLFILKMLCHHAGLTDLDGVGLISQMSITSSQMKESCCTDPDKHSSIHSYSRTNTYHT